MSVSFKDPLNNKASELMKDIFKDILAMDDRTALVNDMHDIKRDDMNKLANAAGQPVTVELNSIGDRKEVGGIVYELDEKGWRKLPIGTKLND